jgi:hypothetical protein
MSAADAKFGGVSKKTVGNSITTQLESIARYNNLNWPKQGVF